MSKLMGGVLVPISDKTRKLLWGGSGNRCLFCKQVLVIIAIDKDNPSIVGEECHIISRQTNGPRYNPNFPIEELDMNNNNKTTLF
jgi:hypothetical protein